MLAEKTISLKKALNFYQENKQMYDLGFINHHVTEYGYLNLNDLAETADPELSTAEIYDSDLGDTTYYVDNLQTHQHFETSDPDYFLKGLRLIYLLEHGDYEMHNKKEIRDQFDFDPDLSWDKFIQAWRDDPETGYLDEFADLHEVFAQMLDDHYLTDRVLDDPSCCTILILKDDQQKTLVHLT